MSPLKTASVQIRTIAFSFAFIAEERRQLSAKISFPDSSADKASFKRAISRRRESIDETIYARLERTASFKSVPFA